MLVATSCRRHRPEAPPPKVEVSLPSLPAAAEPPWRATLEAVRAAADAGQFAKADSILLAFDRAEPESPDANESAFWRAMLRADPRNPAFAPGEARAAMEGYLANPNARRRVEASVMLRMLALSDSLWVVQASLRSASEARDRARDEELQKLRDDLQRTQAEMDRIKRRLGAKP